MPLNVVVPVPDWIRAPAPEMTPDTAKVPDWAKFTVPALAMVPLSVPPVASSNTSVAPLETLDALEDTIDPLVPLPICNVPAETVVPPV